MTALDVAKQIFVLTVGGALGVNARYWLGLMVSRRLGPGFPWATVLINVSGSFAIGLGAAVLAARWPHPLVRVFALTGFLGGYTTFSAYMFESFTLWERGDRAQAAGNVLGSVAAGLLAVALGVAAGRWLAPPAAPEAAVERRVEAIGEALGGDRPSAGETA